MSGRKETYVSVRDTELNRLREQDARLRTVQSDLPDRLNRMRSEITGEINNQAARLEGRLGQFQQTADKLRSELADVERRNQERLQQGLQNVREELRRGLAESRREYTQLINQEREARQRQMELVQSRVSKLENDASKLSQMAEAMLEDVRLLRDDVDMLPHERFAPGRMTRIANALNLAALNLESGASQASLVQSQQAYVELCELREEVLFKEREFLNEYYRALEAVRALIEEVRDNAQMRLGREQAGEDDFEVDVDFWSKSRLSEHRSRIQAIETALQNGRETLTLQQVQEYESEAARLRAELPAIVEAARLGIINSQACYNVAQVVASVIEGQGYEVEAGTYQGEDQRAPYAVKLRNSGGDEVISVITPSPGQELGYSVQMNFYDRSRDETARTNFARSVYEALNTEGLQATPPETTLPTGSEDNELRDMERFRRERPQLRQTASGG